jgi:hypothetical protein
MFACAVTKAGALATSSKQHSFKKLYGDQTDNWNDHNTKQNKDNTCTFNKADNKHNKDNTQRANQRQQTQERQHTQERKHTHTEQSKDNNTQAKRNAVGSLIVFDSHIYAPPMRGNLCASRSGPN